jgi:hypothetical protein
MGWALDISGLNEGVAELISGFESGRIHPFSLAI